MDVERKEERARETEETFHLVMIDMASCVLEGEAEGRGEQSVPLLQLLRRFLDLQQRRALAYSRLHSGFAEYGKSGSELVYNKLCTEITSEFNECSQQVLEVESELRRSSIARDDLAQVLQDVQYHEKKKLQMTAILQVLKRAGRPSEQDHNSEISQQVNCSHLHSPTKCETSDFKSFYIGDTEADAEYEGAFKEAVGALQDAVTAINEHMETIRYEIQDLDRDGK
ncbi:hypothetical protein O6H91_03G101600 [Diphasiastrum complanatum]|uniref:Uncharacterized protein n=1 Tax=Diphasiastrum complanatum TaxID=34168 RepID=A0ACC2E9P5_DIPCM|nr:hypothetical protein O6H91_03G101600 [Diphasiastrum complanatum]